MLRQVDVTLLVVGWTKKWPSPISRGHLSAPERKFSITKKESTKEEQKLKAIKMKKKSYTEGKTMELIQKETRLQEGEKYENRQKK